MRLQIIGIAAMCISLAGCEAPFEEKIVGSWDCKDNNAASMGAESFDITLNYFENNDISGEVRIAMDMGGSDVVLTSAVDGSWSYNGEKMRQSLKTTLSNMNVDGQDIPRDQIPPEFLENDTDGQEDYEDDVQLVNDNTLLWISGDDTMTCTK